MIHSLKHLISYHRYALCAAIFVVCVAGLPQVIARNILGSDDRGIPYLVNDSEGWYLGRIHEILDGHISVSSPVFYEYKDSAVLTPATSEFLFYILPMKLTGLSLNNIVFLSKFVYPSLDNVGPANQLSNCGSPATIILSESQS